jgi:hypothetical protein
MRMKVHIVRAMRRTAFLLAFLMICLAGTAAQASEFGVLVGGSKRMIDEGDAAPGAVLIDQGFEFENQSMELFYGFELDPGTMFKIKVGRIEGPIAVRDVIPGDPAATIVRRDVQGEVQHVEGIIEYRFSEVFGGTGLFAGVGAYRHEANNNSSSTTDFGWTAGVNADFPISRRYGVIVEGAYHWTKGDFEPRYLTISGGLRIAF